MVSILVLGYAAQPRYFPVISHFPEAESTHIEQTSHQDSEIRFAHIGPLVFSGQCHSTSELLLDHYRHIKKCSAIHR